jgi:hypothetical protein
MLSDVIFLGCRFSIPESVEIQTSGEEERFSRIRLIVLPVLLIFPVAM